MTTSINRLIKVGDEHLLRVESDHRETSIRRPPGIVIGERNRSRSVQPLQVRWRERKASTSEYGRETISTTGTKRARAIFQNGVWGKRSRQKTCQRAMVRRSAPKRVESSRTRRGDGPLPHGADQDDDGTQVDLWPEESHRRRCDSLSAAIAVAAEAQPEGTVGPRGNCTGVPRGSRGGKLAECRRPPQGHAFLRVSAARS